MKKSLRRKLIMSAVAVGAAAVGTTASTYAWFVSNNTVTASEINGSVVESNANLFILNGENYGQSTNLNISGTKLSPIAIKKNSEVDNFVTSDGTVVSVSDGNTPYVSFELKFKTTGIKENESYSLNISSVTASATTQSTYTAVATAGGLTKGQQVNGNVTESLILSYSADAAITPTTVKASQSLNLNTDSSETQGNAKEYYKAVTGNDLLSGCETITEGFGADGYKALDTNKDGYAVKSNILSNTDEFSVYFVVWLNGDDEKCFDAIASQAWKLSLNFKLVKTTTSD